MEKKEMLTQVMSNEAFAARAKECKTMEELHALFKEFGADVTIDEVAEICHQVAEQVQSGNELSEDQLENVAGGFAWIPVAVGVWAVGCVAVGLWNGYHSH